MSFILAIDPFVISFMASFIKTDFEARSQDMRESLKDEFHRISTFIFTQAECGHRLVSSDINLYYSLLKYIIKNAKVLKDCIFSGGMEFIEHIENTESEGNLLKASDISKDVYETLTELIDDLLKGRITNIEIVDRKVLEVEIDEI